jgi:hypothetical protein
VFFGPSPFLPARAWGAPPAVDFTPFLSEFTPEFTDL